MIHLFKKKGNKKTEEVSTEKQFEQYVFENYSSKADASMVQHTAIFGQTGSGKSFLLKEAIYRLMKEKNENTRIILIGDKREFSDILKIATEEGFINEITFFDVDYARQILMYQNNDNSYLSNLVLTVEMEVRKNHSDNLRTYVFFSERTFNMAIHILFDFVKQARLLNCVITIDCGCSLEDFKDYYEQGVLNNMGYIIFLSMLPSDREKMKELFALKDEELKLCTNRCIGEGLVLCCGKENESIDVKEYKDGLWAYIQKVGYQYFRNNEDSE